MSNSYGVLGYGILKTFLLGPANYNQSEKSLSMRTNLHNVVQKPDERVAILKPDCQLSSTNLHRIETHFRNTWDFCHLYLIVTAVLRVVWRRFCCSLHWPGPEEDAFCSETPYEDALIRSRRWVLLSIQQMQSAHAKESKLGETDRVETTITIPHWSLHIAPNKTRLTAISERSARQRNFRFHSVVHERSDGP